LIKLAVILGGAYAIWTFIAQNIDKPRHIIPLAALIVFLLVAVVFSEGKRKIRLAALALTVVIIGVQVYYASGFIREQASKPPATYQLAAYLKEQEHSFVLYTWEET